MSEKPFLTVAKETQHENIIKKSRFICSIKKVTSEEEAQNFVNQIKEEHRKATHNCFAYMVGDTDQIQRESDNGEPSGTAGVPILESIKLANLHNTCAVVTRYFGGIKLGAGGLIRAYSNVTTDAIRDAGVVQRIKQTAVEITVSYADHDQLIYYLKQKDLQIASENYGVDVKTWIFVNNDQVDNLTQELTNSFNGQLIINKGDQRDNEVPYKG